MINILRKKVIRAGEYPRKTIKIKGYTSDGKKCVRTYEQLPSGMLAFRSEK